MPALEEISTITAKGQTTVPRAIRQVLGVDVGDQIAFRVDGERVIVVPVGASHEDPVVGKFLDFLARDLEKRPHAVKPLSKDFAKRMGAVAKGARVDLDAPIEGDVDI
jgi:antitoxin PrlF